MLFKVGCGLEIRRDQKSDLCQKHRASGTSGLSSRFRLHFRDKSHFTLHHSLDNLPRQFWLDHCVLCQQFDARPFISVHGVMCLGKTHLQGLFTRDVGTWESAGTGQRSAGRGSLFHGHWYRCVLRFGTNGSQTCLVSPPL